MTELLTETVSAAEIEFQAVNQTQANDETKLETVAKEEVDGTLKFPLEHEYTFEEVYHLNSKGGRYELVDGRLVEKMGANFSHGEVILELGGQLKAYAKAQNLGKVSTDAGYVLRTAPKRLLRFPDISFVAKSRMPAEGVPIKGYWEFVPDLAIEVVSAFDIMNDVFELAGQYIEVGVKEVWLVVPAARTVTIFRSFEEQQLLTLKDMLEGGEMLPGFEIAVQQLFV